MIPANTPDDEKPGLGRDIRLGCGVLALLALGYLLYAGTKSPTPYTTRDLVLYAMLLVTSLLLITPRRALQLLTLLKDKIPGLGSKP